MWIQYNAFDNGSTDYSPVAQAHPLQITVMKKPLPDRTGVLS
jgi:hypothetical protein